MELVSHEPGMDDAVEQLEDREPPRMRSNVASVIRGLSPAASSLLPSGLGAKFPGLKDPLHTNESMVRDGEPHVPTNGSSGFEPPQRNDYQPRPVNPPDTELSGNGEYSASESSEESDDDSTSAEEDEDYDENRVVPAEALQRNSSISGKPFTKEPASMSEDHPGSLILGPPLTTSQGGNIAEPKPVSNERVSLDRIAGTAFPPGAAGSRGPIRSGSIAASKGRVAGTNSTLNSIMGGGSSSSTRSLSPTARQTELALDAKEPVIPSMAEQEPVSSVPVPTPSPGNRSTSHHSSGGGYFAQAGNPPPMDTHPQAMGASGHLHPSSASFRSTLSIGSSSQQHAVAGGGSLPHPQPPFIKERRHTAGSLQGVTTFVANNPRPPESASALRRASQTEVPGLQGSSLDPDILAEADKLRKERLSKRRGKRSSEDDASVVMDGGSPEPGALPATAAAEWNESNSNKMSHGGAGGSDTSHADKTAAAAAATAPTTGALAPTQNGPPPPTTIPVTKPEPETSGPLVGNLIGEDHVNYVLMYNMLTGIRIGVSMSVHPDSVGLWLMITLIPGFEMSGQNEAAVDG